MPTNQSTETDTDTIEVLKGGIFDEPLYKGPAKCIVIRDKKGKAKILHFMLSDFVWGMTTNADADFGDWLKRYGVDE